jgi:hypothetical protein
VRCLTEPAFDPPRPHCTTGDAPFLGPNTRVALSTKQDSCPQRRNVMKTFASPVSPASPSHSPERDCSEDLEGAQPKARTHRTLAPNLTRRSHKKSRGGCFNCKARKIKVRLSPVVSNTAGATFAVGCLPLLNAPTNGNWLALIPSPVSRVSSKL